MANDGLQPVLRHVRRLAAPTAPGLTDEQLLGRFVAGRDEAAFELLLRRHGGMVLGLCRRVARQEQDAEDAFQATFLALARKAGSVGKRASLGSWLYKVAYRAALAVRTCATRRAAVELPLDEVHDRIEGEGEEGGDDEQRGERAAERHVHQGDDRHDRDDGDEHRVGAETTVRMRAGDAYVVPRGVWHRLEAIEPSYLVHVTPGPNGGHRPRDAANE